MAEETAEYAFHDDEQYPSGVADEGSTSEPSTPEAKPAEQPEQAWKAPTKVEWDAQVRRADGLYHELKPLRSELRELRQWKEEQERARQEEELALQAIQEDEKDEELAALRDTDRVAWLAAQQQREADRIAQGLDQVNQRLSAREQQERVAQDQHALTSWVREDAARFRQATPDADNAYRYLIQTVWTQQREAGLSEEEIAQYVQEQHRNAVGVAIANGASPANVLYLSAIQLGYQPGQQQAPQAPPQAAQPTNGQGSLARKRQALADASTVAGASGRAGSAPGKLTPAEFAELDDEEVFQALEKGLDIRAALYG